MIGLSSYKKTKNHTRNFCYYKQRTEAWQNINQSKGLHIKHKIHFRIQY